MAVLLDTHAWAWSLSMPDLLSARAEQRSHPRPHST